MKYLDETGLAYFWNKIKSYVANGLSGKVDKVAGKGLSTEDYTTVEKNKLAGLVNYVLPNASASTLGGVKVGNGLSIDNEGVLSTSGGGGTITDVQQNGTSVVSGGVANVTVPTKTSDITNDSGFITSSSLPTKTSDLTNDSGFITNSVNNLTNYTKSSDLADVATSGDYDDLSNKPTIPTKTSDLTNDSGFLTQHQDISGKANKNGSNATGTWGISISGNATTATSATSATSATKATQDESGNNLKASYGASLDTNGNNIRLKNKNGGILSTITAPYAPSNAPVLLGTVASGSSYAGGTWSYDLSPYKYVMIEFYYQTTNNPHLVILPIGFLSVVLCPATNNYLSSRNVTTAITGITFSGGYNYNHAGNDSYCVPKRVWGIK